MFAKLGRMLKEGCGVVFLDARPQKIEKTWFGKSETSGKNPQLAWHGLYFVQKYETLEQKNVRFIRKVVF